MPVADTIDKHTQKVSLALCTVCLESSSQTQEEVEWGEVGSSDDAMEKMGDVHALWRPGGRPQQHSRAERSGAEASDD